MEKYHVILTPDAQRDLDELDNYISVELLVPDVAAAYIAAIKEKLLSLQTNPKRYKPLDDEPWHSRGVRRVNVKNFAAFYIVLDEYNEVYIQNIIYQKRDLPQILLNHNG